MKIQIWHKAGSLFAAILAGVLGTRAAAAQAHEPKGNDAVIAGNTDFALDLYGRLRAEPGNLFVSPYSISTALAMTYAGARGTTAEQMKSVLHFPAGPEDLAPLFAALRAADQVDPAKAGYELHIANALWGQRGYGFRKPFLDLTQQHYGAGLREVDFEKASEQARQTINTWVAAQTREKIRELLQPNDLDGLTTLVLTNAIYFKGQWASRFDVKRTADGPFRLDAQRSVAVPMMHQTGEFALASADGLDLLELPYRGDRLSMVILLPKTVDGLTSTEQALKRAKLEQWLGQLHKQPVVVTLPRFKLDARFELDKVLAAMGMPDAFTLPPADFSGMTGKRDLFISKVIHQAQAEVNEEGTEAAGATAVVMKRGGPPPKIAEFTADHPFIFLIRDRQTGSILFLGRVAKPGT